MEFWRLRTPGSSRESNRWCCRRPWHRFCLLLPDGWQRCARPGFPWEISHMTTVAKADKSRLTIRGLVDGQLLKIIFRTISHRSPSCSQSIVHTAKQTGGMVPRKYACHCLVERSAAVDSSTDSGGRRAERALAPPTALK